ncbi:MAG: hypothetical protein NC489_27500 [Ruminococcus flavefaciens]|nr:hypothetical protein [Ruminococcus flavefaciens]
MFKYLIAKASPLTVYNVVTGKEAEEQAVKCLTAYLEERMRECEENFNKYCTDYWVNEWNKAAKLVKGGLEVITEEEYREIVRTHYLGKPLQEITEEYFQEQLNILPTLHFVTIGNVEEFCLSEMTYGTFAQQYAYDKTNGKYYTKIVDLYDKSTWIHNLI